MKNLFTLILSASFSSFAFGQTTQLDDTSVALADALVKPEVRECIDSALLANNVVNSSKGTFSIKEVQGYTAQEPLFPGSTAPDKQYVTHYILTARANSKPSGASSQRITIAFDIKIASGTGIPSYSCSSKIQ